MGQSHLNDNEQSRQISRWMINQGYQNRVKAVKKEMAERIEMRKQEERQRQVEEKRERRRQRNKSHPVQIELTKIQEEELLYIAFKPTKKQLLTKK